MTTEHATKMRHFECYLGARFDASIPPPKRRPIVNELEGLRQQLRFSLHEEPHLRRNIVTQLRKLIGDLQTMAADLRTAAIDLTNAVTVHEVDCAGSDLVTALDDALLKLRRPAAPLPPTSEGSPF
jgi:hypothetical protein